MEAAAAATPSGFTGGTEDSDLSDASSESEGATLAEGNLVLSSPWPSMLQTLHGNHSRFEETYFSPYVNKYFSGDRARIDSDGFWWITGRADDVINVSGHRIGTAEIESALLRNAGLAKAAVVGVPHPIKGSGIYCFCVPVLPEGTDYGTVDEEALRASLVKTVREVLGPVATPDAIQFTPGLPETRSGKIMRRILRKVADGEGADGDHSVFGDTSTLNDPSIVQKIIDGKQSLN